MVAEVNAIKKFHNKYINPLIYSHDYPTYLNKLKIIFEKLEDSDILQNVTVMTLIFDDCKLLTQF